MDRRSLVRGNSRYRLNHSQRAVTARRGTKTGDLERTYFEFDRKIVAGVLETVRGAINEGAVQMEMVADERMFDKSLSGTISRTAQQLNQIARKLEKLLDDVANTTGYPEIAMDSQAGGAVERRLSTRQS